MNKKTPKGPAIPVRLDVPDQAYLESLLVGTRYSRTDALRAAVWHFLQTARKSEERFREMMQEYLHPEEVAITRALDLKKKHQGPNHLGRKQEKEG